MADVILLTGIPGVGKTTVATALPPAFERVHFGEILRRTVELRLGRELEHDVFREQFSNLIDSRIINDATIRAREIVRCSSAEVCVLESHAVSPIAEGILVTPDTLHQMELFPIQGIVHLSARGCVNRIVQSSHRHGRRAMTEDDVYVAEEAQLALCGYYASVHGCAAVIVQAVGELPETLKRVEAAIRRVSALGSQK